MRERIQVPAQAQAQCQQTAPPPWECRHLRQVEAQAGAAVEEEREYEAQWAEAVAVVG